MNSRRRTATHDAVIERFPDFVTGNLGWWERLSLNRHLRSCRACQAELANYRRLDRQLKQIDPALFVEGKVSDAFRRRIEETIDKYPVRPQPRMSWRTVRFAVPAATALAIVIAIVVLMTLSGGGASALSLETPVKGTLLVTQGDAVAASGTFSYVSPSLWERSTTYPRAPQSVRALSEIAAGGQTFVKLGDQPWRLSAETPAISQPIPGLGDLGQTERLFDAVLNLYDLEKGGTREFRGKLLTEFTGVDAGYAARYREAGLTSGASEQQVAAEFDLYTRNPPDVTVLADDDERIRAIFIAIPLLESPNPLLVEVVIEESNASVEISPPVP